MLEGLCHFLHLSCRKKRDRIPITFEVKNVAVQFDGVVRRDHVLREEPLAARGNPDLLSALAKMDLSMGAVATFDTGSVGLWRVHNEQSFAQLEEMANTSVLTSGIR